MTAHPAHPGHDTEFPQWFDRSEATHQVVRGILRYGPISRTALARLHGLSQGAVSRITADLIYDGVVEELPADTLPHAHDDAPQRGRPLTALRVRADTRSFLGVNIHDQALTVSQVNARCEPLGTPVTEPLDGADPTRIARQAAQAAARCRDADAPAPVAAGVSIGGHVDDDWTVTYAPFQHWDGSIELGRLMQEAMGLPVKVFNDLDSLLLYESWFGDAVGVGRFAVVTIGAGVGYSLAEHGDAVAYADKSYGLAGHVLVDPEGPRCSAGHVGCSQCLTSDSLAEEYSRIIGRAAGFGEFADDVRANKPQARRLGERTGFRLGVLIATVANLAMPSHVIVSGESSFLAAMFMESIRKGIDSYRPSQTSRVDFTVLPFDWRLWSDAAAARAIAKYVGA